MISTELFPYENHPYRLEFGEKKNTTICFFSCEEHLQKYLIRYKLDTRTIKIDYRDGKSVESGKKHKSKLQSGTGKTSDRSTNSNRRSTKSVDSNRNTRGTRKPKSNKG